MRSTHLLVPLTVLALLAGCTGGGDDTDDLATCLRGEWTPDADAQLAAIDDMLATMGVTGSATISGESVTTIDATTITTTYDDQLTELTMEVDGQTMVSSSRMDGTLSQAYTLDGDVLTARAGDMSAVQVESTVTLDGQELPGVDEASQRALTGGGATGQAGRMQVTCSGDGLTFTTLDLGELGAADMTVTLTRR